VAEAISMPKSVQI